MPAVTIFANPGREAYERIVAEPKRHGSPETRWLIYRGQAVVGWISKFKNTRTDTHPYMVFRADGSAGQRLGLFYESDGGRQAAFALARKEFFTGVNPPGRKGRGVFGCACMQGNCYWPGVRNVGIREAERAATSHMQTTGHGVTILRPAADDTEQIIRPARNPRVRKNPPARRGRVMSHRVVEVRYVHAGDGKAYRHTFKPGVCLEALPDGTLRLYSSRRKPLWDNFK
jgi:hypothetical protein